jgi:hypothetical protein
MGEMEELEARLKLELHEAHAALERAGQVLDAKAELAMDIGLDQPDGTHALKNGASQYTHALKQYSAALKRFSDYVLHGGPPK